jgi:hypothetical protein
MSFLLPSRLCQNNQRNEISLQQYLLFVQKTERIVFHSGELLSGQVTGVCNFHQV